MSLDTRQGREEHQHARLRLFRLRLGFWRLAVSATCAGGRTAVASGFLENVTKAWEARDGRAYAAAFWPDAEIVNVFGGVMNGEKVIATRMDGILKGALTARQSKQSIRKVRMLAPNVIVVDTVNTDAANAAGAEKMFKYILEKRGTSGAPWPDGTRASLSPPSSPTPTAVRLDRAGNARGFYTELCAVGPPRYGGPTFYAERYTGGRSATTT